MITIGNAHIQCPACDEVIEVPISAQLSTGDDGRQYMEFDSDMADIWAHSWAHTEAAQ